MKRIYLHKKLIALFTVIILIFSFQISFSEQPDSTLYTLVPSEPSQYGLINYKIVDPNGKVIERERCPGNSLSIMESYPVSYSSVDAGFSTSVKNQGNTENCWAFSAVSLCESSLLHKYGNDVNTTDNPLDLSEAHLSWFGANTATTDSNDPTYGDGITVSDPYSRGGTWIIAANALARGSGSELEKFAPFYPYNQKAMSFGESERYVREYALNEAVSLPADQNIIKEYIIERGAVQCSMMFLDGYFNSDTGAYYIDNAQYNTNHAVTIVGWNDNYRKNNFLASSQPDSDGAWLVKNSWGADFGNNGYLWISYEDKSISDLVSMDMDYIDFDNIYQYNGDVYANFISYGQNVYPTISNIFTAKSDEQLKAVSVFTCNDNISCKIEIYKGVSEGGSPMTGTKAFEMTSDLTYNGYHKIALNSPVLLSSGERYAVAITMTCAGAVNIPIEGDTQTYSSLPNQSYICFGNQAFESQYGNFYIKAFTSDVTANSTYDNLLNTALNNYTDFNASDYIDPSAERFQVAYTNAKNIINLSSSTQSKKNAYNRLLGTVQSATAPTYITNENDYKLFMDGSLISDTGYYALKNDIALSTEAASIMYSGNNDNRYSGNYYFHENFNGRGFTISGVNIESSDKAALFPVIYNGTVKNLNISGTISSSGNCVGGITAQNQGGIIENCSFSGSVNSTNYCGGIVGLSYSGKIIGCTNYAEVTVSGQQAGGICAAYYSFEPIEKCGNSGKISGALSGGIIGYNATGNLINCWNRGSISSHSLCAGLIAYNTNPSAQIISSYDISGKGPVNNYSGGSASFTNCYSTYLELEGITRITSDQLSSGEAAYMLNHPSLSEASTSVWGTLSGYPIIAGEKCAPTYGIHFTDETFATLYTNSSGKVSFPTASVSELLFAGWTDGELYYTSDSIISSDLILTPKYTEKDAYVKIIPCGNEIKYDVVTRSGKPGIFIIAEYSSNKLIRMYSYTVNTETATTQFTYSPDSRYVYKMFFWDGMNSILPLAFESELLQ